MGATGSKEDVRTACFGLIHEMGHRIQAARAEHVACLAWRDMSGDLESAAAWQACADEAAAAIVSYTDIRNIAMQELMAA